MSPQLQLKLDGKKRRPPATAGLPLWRRCLYWAPVWLPLALFVQVILLGLLPAWAQKQHLDRAELQVEGREAGLTEEHEDLVRDRRKLSDPIYRERVRRSLLDVSRAPLTLETTREEGS